MEAGSKKRRRGHGDDGGDAHNHSGGSNRYPRRQQADFRCDDATTAAAAKHSAHSALPRSTTTCVCVYLSVCRYSVKHPVDYSFLLGQRVSVKFDEAGGWYDGVVSGFRNNTCQHCVSVR